MFRFTIILLLLLLLNSLPSTLSLPCTSLLSLALPNTTILTATGLVPSTVNLSSADPTCDQSFTVPVSLCRLTFKITTSLNSSIFAEAWLPDDWNSRFLATGNGGLNGCIEYTDMSYGTSLGFATVGTNNGHNGNTGAPFENNPSTLEDFAWRALHL
ncbi:Feruloyl esterase, partial [Rhizina undulata]